MPEENTKKSQQKLKKISDLSIGLPKVEFNMLKIKDNVDLAGLSPPPPDLNLLNSLEQEL